MKWPSVSQIVSLFKSTPEDNQVKIPVATHVSGTSRHIASYDFDGEKNLGEAGPIIDYRLAYNDLRLRSWQAMLESDTAQIGINRLITWTIGKGLKPQCEPVDHILNNEGAGLTSDGKKKFSKDAETGFNLYRKSRSADFSDMLTLDELAEQAEKNALVGGDVLVILRVINDCVKVQLIDGQHVQSPEFGNEWWPKILASGNRVIDGVELDPKGKHVAYYVRVSAVSGGDPVNNFRFDRIEARGKKSGMVMAYLYYGSKHRINNVRGIPLISSVIEKIKKIEQYTDSTLSQAKNAAQISYAVEHDLNAEGKNPFIDNVVEGYDLDRGKNLPVTDDGTQLARNVQVTTGNSAWNLPPGAELKVVENKNTLYFKDFYETNSDTVFAVLQIPPNVAMSKYNDSFSASRAAIKDWEHTLVVKREHHQVGFLQPIFNLWLELEILLNHISAPGYIMAKASGNYRVIEAYRNVRFIGPQVPHIDPVKEVTAVRSMLGKAAEHLPLIDQEGAVEKLGGGDAVEINRQMGDELKDAKTKGIEMPAAPAKPGKPVKV